MKIYVWKWIFLLFVSATTRVLGWGNSNNKDRVLLEKVTAITLNEGQMTNGRRSSPVPQLSCMGGSAGCGHKPSTVQCTNVGFDGYDVQWECKAELDNSVKFGKIEVSCEGYDHPDDPYILRGSCGLQYQLEYSGHRSSRHHGNRDYHGNDDYHHGNHHSQGGNSWFGSLIQLVIVGFILYCVVGVCCGQSARRSNSGSSSSSYDSYSSGPASSGGGSGFWSGAATGGALGYMFGSRNSGYGGYGRNYGSRWGSGSSWGSGSGWGSRSGWSSGSGWSGSSRSSSSSSSRSSSGFGGTSRR